MSDELEVVKMSFEDYLKNHFDKTVTVRNTIGHKRLAKLFELKKTDKRRKWAFELIEKSVAKELNMPPDNMDWSQVDWVLVWKIIIKLLPLLLMLFI